MRHNRWSICLLLTAAYLAAPAQALEILRWERLPLAVPLHVDQERVVFIDRNIRVGVPASLEGRLRVQSAGGAIYLRASEPIEPTRLQLQDADTGALILLDVAAEPARSGQPALEPVRIVEADAAAGRYGDAKPAATIEHATEGPGSSPRTPETPIPVVLTRYAAQNLYAPLRTVEPLSGITRVNLPRHLALETLLPTVPVRARALAAWRLDDLWVTAVQLSNGSPRTFSLDPRDLVGDFVTATFQHGTLGPAGQPDDTSVVYLVTKGHGLAQSLLPAIGRIDAAANLPKPAQRPQEPPMKSNGLLKWLMVPLALVLVFAGIQLFSGGSASSPRSPGTRLTAEEAKTLGIDADTPRDTVATLVGQVKQLRTELQGALADNKTQQAENERLRQREGAIDRRIQSALDAERNQLRTDRDQVAGERQQAQGLLQEVQRQIEGLAGKSGDADLPVGLGLEPDAKGAPGAQGMRWIEPDDARRDKKSGVSDQNFSFPTRFGMDKANGASADHTTDVSGQAPEVSAAKPVYTVPTNATLMGSIAMTALIGRVPVDGTVNDPYPFKVLIGPDNLTANGIDIPDVAGAVVSGTASGDWTLSCVRGQIRSVTFVFADGTIRTVPQDRGRGSGNGQQSGTGEDNGDTDSGGTREGLGWISDPYGIPCVSGERRSNAQQYLGTQSLITAAGAGVASLIKSDNGSVAVVANNNGSLGTVGISGNEAMGRILAGGVQDMSQWVNKLYGQAFAAVYVRPGAKVAVHLEQPLTIDYDPKGRKVDHRLGGALHAQDLD